MCASRGKKNRNCSEKCAHLKKKTHSDTRNWNFILEFHWIFICCGYFSLNKSAENRSVCGSKYFLRQDLIKKIFLHCIRFWVFSLKIIFFQPPYHIKF